MFCESFTLFSFIATRAKQHKLKNRTFCNLLNVTFSRIAVTAFNMLGQKPVTRADERRTEFDPPLMTP